MPKKIISDEEALHSAIRMVAPGTHIREALSMVLQAGTGALLCFGDVGKLARLSEGGVQLSAEATPQLIYELSKMDGAIILDEKGTRIHYANRFLRPATGFPSGETGTRHRVAQRMSFRAKCTVVTVSQRRASVTVFCHGRRHLVKTVQASVNKATQAIQTLEKYVAILQQTLKDLTIRELGGWVTVMDVCRVLQRREMAERIMRREVIPLVEELGEEGRLMMLQVSELRKPFEEARLVVRDYARDRTEDAVIERIRTMDSDDMLNSGLIAQALGCGSGARVLETQLSPRGYRVLIIIGARFSDTVIHNLIEEFGSLPGILKATKEQLVEVDGVGEAMAERLRTGVEMLRTQLNMDTRK